MDNRQIPEEIKAKLPIEEVISPYVPLKKAGRVFKGLCPFHNEKTPSFNVNPERGIFKCFGCGEGGDIFEFVMKIEGLTFPEAVRMLADRAGVQIPEYKANPNEPKGPGKGRLFALNEFAATFWHKILTEHPKAEPAREYLRNRGVATDTISAFKIGYAPLGYVTTDTLTRANYTRPELQAAGNPGKFQDRIVFPICDLTGKVVGFTGRLLERPEDPPNANRGPKYWNTPETPLFVKSRVLFALHLAKHAIQDKGMAILAEGQMDVVMLHQAGYIHTVASSGTALTMEQLQLLRRFAPALAFAYDGDKAGREATKRGIELALAAELTPYVISIPSGKDPADAIKQDPSLWEQAYQNRQLYMEWLIAQLLPNGVSSLRAEEKKQVAKEIVQWLSRIPDPTEQAEWFSRAAAHLQTNEENLRELYRRLFPTKQVARATQGTPAATPAPQQQNLLDIVLALLFTFPELEPAVRDQLKGIDSLKVDPALEPLKPLLNQDEHFDTLLTSKLTDQERTNLNVAAESTLQPYEGTELSPEWALQELFIILRRLRETDREAAKTRIALEIKAAQALGNTEKIKELILELQKLV